MLKFARIGLAVLSLGYFERSLCVERYHENTSNTFVELHGKYSYDEGACVFPLPPASRFNMRVIACSNQWQRSAFMDKYLTEVEAKDKDMENVLPKSSCPKLYQLYREVTSTSCPREMQKLTKAVKGAMKRILGKELDRDENCEMFDETLGNLESIEDTEVLALSEQFQNLEKPDYFLTMRAAFFFKEHEGKTMLKALKQAMETYQGVDFDQVERALSYTRILKEASGFSEWWNLDYYQVEMAKQGHLQHLNFDLLDDVARNLAKNFLLNRESLEILTDPKNQDMNWMRVIEMIPKVMAEKNLTTSQRIYMIFDRNHQYNDPRRYEWLFDILENLKQGNPQNRELSREDWVQCDDLDFKKVNSIYSICRDQVNPLSCYKLEIAPLRRKAKTCSRGKRPVEVTRVNGRQESEDESNADL